MQESYRNVQELQERAGHEESEQPQSDTPSKSGRLSLCGRCSLILQSRVYRQELEYLQIQINLNQYREILRY